MPELSKNSGTSAPRSFCVGHLDEPHDKDKSSDCLPDCRLRIIFSLIREGVIIARWPEILDADPRTRVGNSLAVENTQLKLPGQDDVIRLANVERLTTTALDDYFGRGCQSSPA